MGIVLIQPHSKTITMSKTIYIIDPSTRELLGTAEAPLDPVASEQAGELVYAEINSKNATDTKPPEHDKEADDVVLNSKGDWEVKHGAKAKRAEAEAAAATKAEAQAKAEHLSTQLAAMTNTERKLHGIREEDPEAFDAFEAEQALQAREALAIDRLNRHEKHRADKQKQMDKTKGNNGNNSNNSKK
jgi:hypothetical protein